jgi:pyrroline-5-carboxylate reductase
VKRSDVIILAVKPQDFDRVLSDMKDNVKGKLVISIAAGIKTSYIERVLGGARVIRTMPNLAARVGRGMTCLCRGSRATHEDMEFSKGLFGFLGTAEILDSENMMDAATAVSGSGPGFFFDQVAGKPKDEIILFAQKEFIPNLLIAAQHVGFSPEQAKILADTTTSGSIAFLQQTGLSPEQAEKQVASKGGTTEAGLNALHEGGSLVDAVKAALNRSKELSKE